MKIQTPRQMMTDLATAHKASLDALEPIFVPSTLYADDRGWSYMNQMQGILSPQGQVNFSVQYPGVIKAWHRHDVQTDFWMCLTGHMKAGIYRESDGAAWLQIVGEKRPGVLVIPPPLWHGVATVGDVSAGLLYYVTHSYNPAKPDEFRRAHDSVEGFPWHVRHG